MDKNTKTLLSVLLIAAGMVGLAFASVPLYDLFCRVTGFGGTTQVSKTIPSHTEILDREITIRFNGDTNRNLNWQFKPDKRYVDLQIGQQGFISFQAKNKDNQPVTGTAVYNVTPAKAGKYFQKTQCFCFDRQTLEPNEIMDMPVIFYIDPSIADDRNMDDVKNHYFILQFFQIRLKGT